MKPTSVWRGDSLCHYLTLMFYCSESVERFAKNNFFFNKQKEKEEFFGLTNHKYLYNSVCKLECKKSVCS